VFLDMTFGAGGHSRAILQEVPGITIYALDRDPVAYQLAQQLSSQHPAKVSYRWQARSLRNQCSPREREGVAGRGDFCHRFLLNVDSECSRVGPASGLAETACPVVFLLEGKCDKGATTRGQVHPMLGRFSELPSLLADRGLGPGGLDGVLLDAGCSSMQFDSPQRGFSLSKDGPLDMRMDGDRYLDMPTAADVVNVLISSSPSPGAFPAAALYARKDLLQRPAHVATKTFQALRIFVNNELHELHAGLQAAHSFLRPGGRLAVLTFHSLEDRLAKRFLRGEDVAGPRSRSVRQKIRRGRQGGREDGEEEEEEEEEEEGEPSGASGWSQLQKKVMTPRPQDVEENPRGRSAKLRAAQKL
ncbi:MET15 protein, partial [Atractosteus spatula]|nr:MET15 protein [Atractosteus spatula]